jgi:hypothetical protein
MIAPRPPSSINFDADHRQRDGAYSSVPAGGHYSLPGELADDPATARLKELCAAWNVTPRASDPVVDNAAQAPSTLGAGVA